MNFNSYYSLPTNWDELRNSLDKSITYKWKNESNYKEDCQYRIGSNYFYNDITYTQLGLLETELYMDVTNLHVFERLLLDICRKYTTSRNKAVYKRLSILDINNHLDGYQYIIYMEHRRVYQRKCPDCIYGDLVFKKHVMIHRPTRTSHGIMDMYYNCNICNFEEITRNI